MYTMRPWWTVADAARLLRVHRDTLYDACASGDFPHERIGNIIKIPCEALGMLPHPSTRSRTRHVEDDALQMELPLHPIYFTPVLRYRNGEVRRAWDYEAGLWNLTPTAR